MPHDAPGAVDDQRRLPRTATRWRRAWPRPAAVTDVAARPRRRRVRPSSRRRAPPAFRRAADGLLLLPYFAGERTPIFDPDARGDGRRADTPPRPRRAVPRRARGIAYGVRHNLEAMPGGGAARRVAVGGGTQGGLWTQIVSDVTGLSQDPRRDDRRELRRRPARGDGLRGGGSAGGLEPGGGPCLPEPWRGGTVRGALRRVPRAVPGHERGSRTVWPRSRNPDLVVRDSAGGTRRQPRARPTVRSGPAVSRAATVRPVELRTEGQVDPIGLGTAEPRLSWKLAARPGLRGVRQAAYQVEVAGEAAGLLWDSGRVPSGAPWLTYAGLSLRSRDGCRWRVRVWDGDGGVSAWSEPATFEIGLLREDDWQAAWIGGAQPAADARLDFLRVPRIWLPPHLGTAARGAFRRRFVVDAGTVASARLQVAGGAVTAWLNGVPVGSSAPDATLDVDVAGFVEPGDNVLALEARPGPGTRAGLIGVLVVTDRDGAVHRIGSDDGWSCAAEPPEGWQSADCHDSAWPLAIAVALVGRPALGTATGRHPAGPAAPATVPHPAARPPGAPVRHCARGLRAVPERRPGVGRVPGAGMDRLPAACRVPGPRRDRAPVERRERARGGPGRWVVRGSRGAVGARPLRP